MLWLTLILAVAAAMSLVAEKMRNRKKLQRVQEAKARELHKLASTQMNIGNRTSNELREFALRDGSVIVVPFPKNGNDYTVHVGSIDAKCPLFAAPGYPGHPIVTVGIRLKDQKLSIDTFYGPYGTVEDKKYGTSEDEIIRMLRDVKENIAKYIARRPVLH